jgi:putative salt-induced outer membrane protein YdiY
MEMALRWIIFFLVAAVLLPPSTIADQVTLKNGDRLTGTIIKYEGKTLIIKTEAAGEVTFQWSAIDGISSTQPLHVGVNGGQMIVGTVATTDGKIQITTQATGIITTGKDSIQVIRSDSEQASYDAGIDRLRNPHLTDFWSGFMDTGLSVTRGNSNNLNFALSGNAVRKSPRDTITAYFSSIFANNGTIGPTVTTANAIGGGIRVDLNVRKRLYVFGFTDFYHDQFQMLNLRNVLGGGAGYHVVDTKPTVFDVYGGGAFNQSYYSTPLTQQTGEIIVGEYLTHAVSNRMTFSERFDFFPNVSNTGQYRFNLDSHAVTKLNRWLGWQVSFGNIYVSNPPLGVKNNDLILSTGLRLTFGGVTQ